MLSTTSVLQRSSKPELKLLQAEKVAERAALHFKSDQRMRHFQTLGSEVMALYGDDENPITWYRAVVDRVITRDEKSGKSLTSIAAGHCPQATIV